MGSEVAAIHRDPVGVVVPPASGETANVTQNWWVYASARLPVPLIDPLVVVVEHCSCELDPGRAEGALHVLPASNHSAVGVAVTE